jgi:hypothetical protein
MKTTVVVSRGERRETRKNALEDWVDRVHPHCTGNLYYGWKYAQEAKGGSDAKGE